MKEIAENDTTLLYLIFQLFMANVTYLLGAGASCKCLPTYANFGIRFDNFRKKIAGTFNDLNAEEKEVATEIENICEALMSEFKFHSTPDTIAKKYFHLRGDGQKRLDNLKIILVLFFLYEQCISEEHIHHTPTLKDQKGLTDKRYDSFIAAMLEPKYYQIKIQPNISILTWNYDLQFELCFRNYFNGSLQETQAFLQSIPSGPTLVSDFKFDTSKFSIVHLNGIAYSKTEASTNDYPYGSFLTGNKELVKEIIKHYKNLKNSKYPLMGKGLLNFAWERDESFPQPKHALDQIIKCTSAIAQKTDILVIVGYSFPIFNRAVDTEIFRSMSELKKIHIQSPIADDLKDVVLDAFEPVNFNINESMINTVKALEYFHIPHEMNRDLKQSEFDITVR